MVTDNEVKELFDRICSIMGVQYYDMVTLHHHRLPSLVRAFCIYYALNRLGATRKQVQRLIPITLRNITKGNALIREGIVRESYYREPYELIEKGLSE